MFVGIWAVDADGNGTLIQVVPPFAVAPLEEIDSISTRDTTINEALGLRPSSPAVRSPFTAVASPQS